MKWLMLAFMAFAGSAHAARLADCVLKPGESADYRNSHFAVHIGYQAGLSGPSYEYFIPTIYSKSKWLLDQYGKTVTVVPGTDYVDYSIPANRTAMTDCIVQWVGHFNAPLVGVFLDCLNLTAPGQFWYSVDLFREIKRVFPPMMVCVNFGDVYSWTTNDPTSPWYALAQEADVQFPQVAVSFGDTRLEQFTRAVFFSVQRLNAGKMVILGVLDPGGTHAADAVRIFEAQLLWINPRYVGWYCSDANPKAPVATQYPTSLPEPVTPGISVPFGRSSVYLPADNWWNLDVTNAPVDPNSAAIIATIKSYDNPNNGRLHPDFTPNYGIPYVIVDGSTPLVTLRVDDKPNESDPGPMGWSGPLQHHSPGGGDNFDYDFRETLWPIPAAAASLPLGSNPYIENAGGSDGDRHVLILDITNNVLYETSYMAFGTNSAGTGSYPGKWSCGYAAKFDLKTNARRPEGWSSTSAGGMAVLAGLVRPDEFFGNQPIMHAFRFSIKRLNKYVWPASHTGSTDAGAPPLGVRLRLKASFDIAAFIAARGLTGEYAAGMTRVLQAMKTHGLICDDRGGNMYIQGVMDSRWDNGIINPAFHSLHVTDFEIIQLGWKP